ncbi:N-acetylmuramoyl-L-alanine amidase [Spirochaeta cellobiosiphila]|uniref:N-acetylmuramoyl-L-alanine amidase n=1 Tax=Spirochaeta cellobiosiphila TaxID=504483 RepID=UPI00146A55EA|nr:N-acetylmuramoyl-L-alanine amidase [Spirochaeta cellobiosiphila]
MRKLKKIDEYTKDTDPFNDLKEVINEGKFNKELMPIGKKDKKDKKAICLHFTAGATKGADGTTCKTPSDLVDAKRHAVNYWVYRDGTIVEYMEPEYWAHHSSCGDKYNPQVIAIEIVNYGPIYLEGSDLKWVDPQGRIWQYCELDAALKGPDKAYIDLMDNDYDKLGRYKKNSYRGYRYYPAFASEQVVSVAKLLKSLCNEYDIPYRFLPYDMRFDKFSTGETTMVNVSLKELVTAWNFMDEDKDKAGIFSHVNTNGEAKWDIGPAFDWEFLENYGRGCNTCFPLEIKSNTMTPLHWLKNIESESASGYYPIGSNLSVHTGVHISTSNPDFTPVRAMANGYIIAFKFYTEKEQSEFPFYIPNINQIGHAGFILMKHDLKNIESSEDKCTFYSMYMHLQPPEKDPKYEVPLWYSKLKALVEGGKLDISYGSSFGTETDSTDNFYMRDSHDDLKEITFIEGIPRIAGTDKNTLDINKFKIITLSEPWLHVNGGDIIGYTKPLKSEQNYVHWETFSTSEDNDQNFSYLLKLIKSKFNTNEISFEHLEAADDSIYEANELNNMFDNSEGRFIKSLLHNTYYKKTNNDVISAYDKIKSVYNNQNHNFDLTIQVLDELDFELKDDIKLTIKNSENTLYSQNYNELINNNGSLPVQSLEFIECVSDSNTSVSFNIEERNQFDLFKEFVNTPYSFRNSQLNLPSTYTCIYFERIFNKLNNQGRIDLNLNYDQEFYTNRALFDSQEVPIFDSIFSGANSLINLNNNLYFNNPAIILWMLTLLQETITDCSNDFWSERENPLTNYGFCIDDENKKLGGDCYILIVAKYYRRGKPDKADDDNFRTITINSTDNDDKSLKVHLDNTGKYTSKFTIDKWGKYKIDEGLSTIQGLESSFMIPKPKWGKITHDKENNVLTFSDIEHLKGTVKWIIHQTFHYNHKSIDILYPLETNSISTSITLDLKKLKMDLKPYFSLFDEEDKIDESKEMSVEISVRLYNVSSTFWTSLPKEEDDTYWDKLRTLENYEYTSRWQKTKMDSLTYLPNTQICNSKTSSVPVHLRYFKSETDEQLTKSEIKLEKETNVKVFTHPITKDFILYTLTDTDNTKSTFCKVIYNEKMYYVYDSRVKKP